MRERDWYDCIDGSALESLKTPWRKSAKLLRTYDHKSGINLITLDGKFNLKRMMGFTILPQECLLLIISFIIQSSPTHRRDVKSWKKKMTQKQIRGLNSRMKWRPPPFTSMFDLIFTSKGMKEIFDTNDVWTYLYEQEFRNGLSYTRKPKNAKKMMFLKSNEIIKQRYEPILKLHKEKIITSQEKLRVNLHQIHTLDKAFSNIRPQIKDRDNIDKHIDKIGVVLPTSITLGEGYIYPWGTVSTNTIRIDVTIASEYVNSHRIIASKLIDSIRNSREIINKVGYLNRFYPGCS